MNLKFLLLITLMSFSPREQHTLKGNNQRETVKINNWGERLLFMTDDFWESAAKKLVPQFGQEQYLKIKELSNRSQVPCQMQLICEDLDGSRRKNQDSLYTKLNKLVLYKIATFPYKHPDGIYYDYVIIEVPYDENKNWDNTAKWKNFYSVFPADVVQKVK